MFVGVIMQAKH